MDGQAWSGIGPNSWAGIFEMVKVPGADGGVTLAGSGVGECSSPGTFGRMVPVPRRPDDPPSQSCVEVVPPEPC